MGIGVSIFFLAVGAILLWAIEATVSGVSLDAIGIILMIVGGLGLVVSSLFLASWAPFGRQGEVVERREGHSHSHAA